MHYVIEINWCHRNDRNIDFEFWLCSKQFNCIINNGEVSTTTQALNLICLNYLVSMHTVVSSHVVFDRSVVYIVLTLDFFFLSCCSVPLVVLSLLPPPCPALPFFFSFILSYFLSLSFVCLWFQWTSIFPNAPFRGRKVLGVLKLPLKTQV